MKKQFTIEPDIEKFEDTLLILGMIASAKQREVTADFVTEVDYLIEKEISSIVKKIDPEAKFISEEKFDETESSLSLQDTYFCDPIDATTNYFKQNVLFDISLAKYSKGKPKWATVLAPKLKKMYLAQNGKSHVCPLGEFDDRTFSTLSGSSETELSNAVICYNRSHHPYEIKESGKRILTNLVDKAGTLRVFGTGSLDCCFAAEGQVDGLICPLAEKFHTGGYMIMQNAGLTVTDFEGKAWTPYSKNIVAAPPELHKQLLEEIV